MAFSPLFAHPRRWNSRSIARATPRLRSSALPRNRSEALPLEFTHFLSDEVRLTPIIKGKMRFRICNGRCFFFAACQRFG